MKRLPAIFFFLWFSGGFSMVFAQKNIPAQSQEQCGTMQRLKLRLERNPVLKARFTQELESFNRAIVQQAARPASADQVTGITYTIPVVFHIVLTDPSAVTDAQIYAQLDILNKDYAGSADDSIDLPDYFKPLFGKSSIRFCLAQRTPDDESSTGIDRVTTTKAAFSASDDGVKHASTGGVDLWNGDKYLNVWVCNLSNILLGYGTFPDDGQPGEQGVVIDYRSLPGGSFANYNGGKTLTHETGHYFNLYHTWGDDDGSCSGTDYVDDTPNQANSSSGCYSGIKTDNCTTGGNGILYQDYMDYSYDKCMLLFTPLQAARMESALLTYRSSLTVSNACIAVIDRTLDAQLKRIDAPAKRICVNNFTPVVTISNRGSETLSSVIVNTMIDNGAVVAYTWKGTLSSTAIATITLNPLTVGEGNHILKIFVTSPNGQVDENANNDTLTTAVQYYSAVTAVSEGFEGSVFPPWGWDILNNDQSFTWKKVSGIAKTGNASVMIDNFDYTNTGQQDYLRLPEINLTGLDSAYLYFQVAASTFSATFNTGNSWDTLEVMVSKDCGATYTSLYKNWGAKLVTTESATTRSFEPTSAEWRMDSVNLSPFIGAGPLMLAFRNTTEYENNIYLDDINLKTQLINPRLKESGFLVTPNPATDNITVQFYPNPTNLLSVQLYNLLGQKVAEKSIGSGQGAAVYTFNIGRNAAGTYILRAVFTDKILTKKIIKN